MKRAGCSAPPGPLVWQLCGVRINWPMAMLAMVLLRPGEIGAPESRRVAMKNLLALLPLLALSTTARAADPAPVQVVVLGTFHMSNPGKDLHNQHVDDMLSAPRQEQIAALVEALARFAPTRVVVEWPAQTVAERYPKYLAGTLAPSRNEVVQLGFRLGKLAKASVEGIDVEGDFPYGPVEEWAKAHGRKGELDEVGAVVERQLAAMQKALDEGGVAGELRFLNEPAGISGGHAFYRSMLRYGAGNDQPGAALVAAWYRRNLELCARIAQSARPGDRIVVLYGAGHLPLLRQCVEEMPGWKLVEANKLLP